ncbi:beta-1,3-galactosyltransferase 1-like [Physella acuta]|uniref:beta-1,3-galactosyltransferase 1-like n=1 Tax=Physella acuta TaxID=109671 RepID=UPI0027DD71DD|nr:beta-1,3-galactosyltransferase 1-like [Physella acuta]
MDRFSPWDCIKNSYVWLAGGYVMGKHQVLRTFVKSYKATLQELLKANMSSTDKQIIGAMYSPEFRHKQELDIQGYSCVDGQFGLHNTDAQYFCLSYVCRDEIELFIGVATRFDNFKGRQAIRETWGSYANVSSHNSILVFFIGQPEPGYPKASLKQKLLLKESAKYGDILQEDYLDCYHNLSLKSVSIIKYVSTYCSMAKYILKADEDMYINFNCLIDTFVMGTKYVKPKPPPIRSTKSKWYISKADYPKSRYPDYVSGGAYVMSTQASWLLFEASLRLPLFRWEDVYVTGMCSKKAGVEVIDNDRFTYEMYDVSDMRSRISGHPYTPTEMQEMYSELKSDTSCE